MAGRRPLTTWRTTPGRMTITMIGLIAAALLWGVVATTGAIGRSDEISSVHGASGPLAINAQELYRALSDADAAAATAFLSAGAEPPDLRTRYLNDIAAAGHAIVIASTDAPADATVATALQTLSAGLPVYT